MDTRVEDLIDDYIEHYGVSAAEAVRIMKEDLDEALKERGE